MDKKKKKEQERLEKLLLERMIFGKRNFASKMLSAMKSKLSKLVFPDKGYVLLSATKEEDKEWPIKVGFECGKCGIVFFQLVPKENGTLLCCRASSCSGGGGMPSVEIIDLSDDKCKLKFNDKIEIFEF